MCICYNILLFCYGIIGFVLYFFIVVVVFKFVNLCNFVYFLVNLFEFELIWCYFIWFMFKVILGVGDDCVLFVFCFGYELVIFIDMLVVGCYFFLNVELCVFGYKVFVVNFLDLVVMGVELCVFMLVVVLFEVNLVWFKLFFEGLFVLVDVFYCEFIGGDIMCGLFILSLMVFGDVLVVVVLCCDVVCFGDDFWVLGIVGDV